MVLHVSHFPGNWKLKHTKKKSACRAKPSARQNMEKKPAESADKGWQRLGTTVGARLVDELVDSTTNKMMISSTTLRDSRP